jgi:hypothetical protein
VERQNLAFNNGTRWKADPDLLLQDQAADICVVSFDMRAILPRTAKWLNAREVN